MLRHQPALPVGLPWGVVVTNPPGSRRPQLPDEVRSTLSPYPYLSAACETGRRVDAATIRHPERADLPAWVERLHRQCPLTHKFTGDPCNCRCHRPTA